MPQPRELEYYRGNLQRQMSKQRNILIDTDRAVVMQDQYPKAQYHFLVVAKEDIENVTKLTEEHLPLLDHMMELAHRIIEEKAKDLSSKFRIGFKTHAFMNRLNLHVISDDYYAFSMRRINHWNSFHTELFLPFKAAYLMLQINGCIEEMSHEKAEKLKMSTPLKCVHCDFTTSSMVDLKAHLYPHWQKRESERDQLRLESLTSVLEAIKLEETTQDAEKETTKGAEKKAQEAPKLQQINTNNYLQQMPTPFLVPKLQQINTNNYLQQMPTPFLVPGLSSNMINYQHYQQNGMNPNNPFRQPPRQYHEQRPPLPNQGPRFNPRGAGGNPRHAMNAGNSRMHLPPNGPRQPYPNYQNNNYSQGPNQQNYNNTINHQGGPRFPKNNNRQQKPPPQQQQQQQVQKSEQSNSNPVKKDESNAAGSTAAAAAPAKPFTKKKWNKPKKKPPTQAGAGGTKGTAKTESSGSQPKPATF